MIYDFIFVVLCYRNTSDLTTFIESVKGVKGTYKVVVVNSYYDDVTKVLFEKIAFDADCDFLNVENKGYGAGNNRGIEYVNSVYKYRYLVISNPDIIFHYFSIDLLNEMEDFIIGPQILTLNHKHQNPYKPRKLWIIDTMEYYGYKYKSLKPLFYAGAIINRLIREYILYTNRIFKVSKRRVYTVHGSCLLLGYKAVNKFYKIYDENMFLFVEEEHVGQLARKLGIDTYMVPTLRVLHKEDGSISLINESLNKHLRDSYLYCYENWYKNVALTNEQSNF